MRSSISNYLVLLAFALLLPLGGCGKSSKESGNSTTTNQVKDGQSAEGKSEEPTPVKITPPEVVLETSKGPITIRLNVEKSPRTVENFLAHVKSHFYDQTVFHCVEKDKRIIGGAFSDTMEPKSAGVPIFNEAHNGLKNQKFTVAMLHDPDSPDTATTAFFINVVDNPAFDFADRTPEKYGYCVFGEVIGGLDAVNQIASVMVHDQGNLPSTPVQPIVIKTAKQTK